MGNPARVSPRNVRLTAGRVLKVTPVFDTYWRFATLRQNLFMSRVLGAPPPWTQDPVLVKHRFTNAYRASDRVSQYLIRNVLYKGEQIPDEIFFRTLLFKFFNRIDTWEEPFPVSGRQKRTICRALGCPACAPFADAARNRAP